MEKLPLSRFTQINILIIFAVIVIYFIVPFIKEVEYKHKTNEAIAILNTIQDKQNSKKINEESYISLKKGDTNGLKKIFSQNEYYYEYTIMATNDSYLALAEPKIEYLKDMSIEPKIYYIKKLRNHKVEKSWEK